MVLRRNLLLVFAALVKLTSGPATGSKKATAISNSVVVPQDLCGDWIKGPKGGSFTSSNYPEKCPSDRQCTYILEASPRQCIDLYFDERYSVELSWGCRFDHIEVRDGPFSFSPIISRYCGQESPVYIRSSGRYLWIKFVVDGELEAIGFSARYSFTQDPDFKDVNIDFSVPSCEFEVSGPEGIVESAVVVEEIRPSAGRGNGLQVVHPLAARIEAPCDAAAYLCHSIMCIKHTLVCNGIRNCVYPWDENGCRENKKPTILESLDSTSVTTVGVTCGVVFLLLVVSIIIQVKQPRKKYILRCNKFHPALLREAFEPPHYELCTLRLGASAEAETPAKAPPDDFPRLQHPSSRCVHGHHCARRVSSEWDRRIDLRLDDTNTVLTVTKAPPLTPTSPPPLLHNAGPCSQGAPW